MQKLVRDKQIKKAPNKEEAIYFFPEWQVSFKAESEEKAREMLKKWLEKK